ncbi:MAG: hypothetical protein F4220_12255 [Gammaproteobacteria bacterium]|nr:hypothetical protein [Gammaproteobacteria bacterium]
MKEHFAAEQQAREVVDPFARNWEFHVCVQRGPGCFELEFGRAEIIDRRPTPGVIEVSAGPVRWEISVSTPSVTVGLSAYPSPPTDIDTSDPDVQTLWERYRRYREGREELPSFACFCLTVLERWAEKTQGKGKAGSRLQLAAATCFVERKGATADRGTVVYQGRHSREEERGAEQAADPRRNPFPRRCSDAADQASCRTMCRAERLAEYWHEPVPKPIVIGGNAAIIAGATALLL